MAIRIKSAFKAGISILLVLLLVIALAVYWLLNTQSGLAWALKQASPIAEVRSFSGNALSAELIGLHVDVGALKISAQKAQLDWSLLSLWNKSLTINALNLSQLVVTLKEQTQTTPTPYQPWLGLDLPIDVNLQHANLTGLSIVQNNTELLSLDQINLQANINSNLLTIEQFAIQKSDNSATLLGRVDLSAKPNGIVDLQNSASWKARSYQVVTQGAITGEWQKLAIKQSVSSPFALQLDASLNDGLTELLSWNAALKTSQLPDQQLMGEVITIDDGAFESAGQFAPGQGLNSLQASLHGGLSGGNAHYASWQIDASTEYQQGDLLIEALQLTQLDTPTPSNLTMQGMVNNVLAFINADYGVGQVDVSGNWNRLQWPIISNSPDVLADGQFSILGNSDNYQLTANTDGKLQGRSLQANVDANLAPELFVINNLNLFAGDTKAVISGKIDTNFDVNWEINSPDIGDLLPDASGNFTSRGHLTGSREKPTISLHADSQGLNTFGYSVAALQLKANASLANMEDELNVVFNAGKISNTTNAIAQSVDFVLSGTGLQHNVAIKAILGANEVGTENNNSDLSINAEGGIKDQSWIGQLSELTITNSLLKTWSLRQAVDLSVAQNSINTSNACLINSNQSVCFQARQNSQALAVTGNIHSLNLANLDQFTRAYDLSTVGIVNGDFSYVKADTDSNAMIDANLESISSTISWPEPDAELGERDSLIIDSLNLTIKQDNTVSASAAIKLNNGDLIDAKIDIADALESPTFNSAPLAGQVNIVFQQLENLPPSLLNDVALNGSFTSKLTVGGALRDPSLTLLAEVNNATANIAVLDLQLEKINIRASSNDSSIINLNGGLESGEGQLDINGTFDLSTLSAPIISIQLEGENLQLANTSELNVVGDVNFATYIDSQLIDLKGSIIIDQAELDFKLPDNAVLASNDVVLVGQENVVKGASQQLDLTIDLGQKTHIQAKGLDANLTGKLRVFQTPNSIIRGEGEINVVNGLYAAYGEELEIERGRLIFNSGSIDDPNLELRAQKTVDSITAGVSVVGRASSPELNLYSTPSMSDQDILSVLIFDKPLGDIESQDGLTLLRIVNSLRGDGEASQITKTTDNIRESLGLTDLSLQLGSDAPSIEAGKQLSSKFYVGYGYGLLDAAQSLILKYQLSQAWSIKADVGADSGADLRYQVER